MLRYIDVHSHIAGTEFDVDRDAAHARMEEAGVGTITIGVDLESSRTAIACAEQYENVWATIGLHPLDNKTETFDLNAYAELVTHPKAVGVGECGLDYYRTSNDEIASSNEKERQKERFKQQIEFALEYNKPLMIHGRPSAGTMDAYEDILSLLEQNKGIRGNVHFFVGDVGIAERFFNLGFTVSFSGVITFAREYKEVVGMAPLEMIHAETDSPYAAPIPHRGKRNEPSFVVSVIEKIAEIKGDSPENVAKILAQNAKRVFGVGRD